MVEDIGLPEVQIEGDLNPAAIQVGGDITSTAIQVVSDLDIHLGNAISNSTRVWEAFLSRRTSATSANQRKAHKIITKFVDDMLGIEELQSESRMYKELGVHGFDLLPISYGLFGTDNGKHVILLEHAGEPLAMDKKPKVVRQQRLERSATPLQIVDYRLTLTNVFLLP